MVMMIKGFIRKIYRILYPIRNIGKNNVFEIYSKLKDVEINVNGNHNLIHIGADCIVNGCNIYLSGDNNTLIVEDKARLLGGANIIMDGNSTIQIGYNAGVRKVDFLAKEANIEIGELCMFSNNIIVRNHDSHRVLNLGSSKITNPPKDIVLGRHVWIGQNVTILKGVTIGDDSVLALGSVVTKSCPANSIMAGNPAKIVKSEVTWDY